MGGSGINAKIFKKILIILPILIVILFITHLSYIDYLNQEIHSVAGDASDSPVYMHINGRSDATSDWKKKDYDLYGDIVTLNAKTIDGTFYNHSPYEIEDWKLTVRIQSDCLLNNAWNGTVEIHQHVNEAEKVQTLDLGSYDLDQIEIDYLYDGDLLVPLYAGDYFIYYPASESGELPVNSGYELTIGFNLYSLETPAITDYDISFCYHLTLKNGFLFWIVIGLIILWLCMCLSVAVSYFTYKTTVREMEIKKTGILSMSDIYAIIYIIDLEKNELMPLIADEASEKLRPKNLDANAQLRQLCEYDCSEAYRDIALEFCDLNTIAKRFENKNTIVFEYVSKVYGWCQIRFFAMDRKDGAPLTKVVYTIRVINDEKSEMETMLKRVNAAENNSRVQSAFLENIISGIRTPLRSLLDLDSEILEETNDPRIRSRAAEIRGTAGMLLLRINEFLDFSRLETKKIEPASEEYSLKEFLFSTWNIVSPKIHSKNLKFSLNLSPGIPDCLIGDKERIQQILVSLLSNAVKFTQKGTITLSVYGKASPESVHLLVSVKDTGIGMEKEALKDLIQKLDHPDFTRSTAIEEKGISLILASGLLHLMHSELKIISTPNEGSEFYFEIEQKPAGSSEIGNLCLKDLGE